MKMEASSGISVQSPIGKRQLDNAGAAIGAARMNPDEAYGAIPVLLKEYIDSGSENAWREIRRRIDNVYVAVSDAMEALDAEEPFSEDTVKLLKEGKKLLFKPNLITLPTIDLKTHGPGFIAPCTPWEFVAALMRWFHDKRDISYHQMAVGEAGAQTTSVAALAIKTFGIKSVTPQAIMEGKYGQNYGGWGFYFVRKYLAECHDPSHGDDPMSGYEDSLSGVCVPPGKVDNKLLVYDLSKIADDFSNGRDVPVPDGVNFKSITLHKAIIGGDPNDPEDLRNWPGSVLVNVSKLKIHAVEPLTATIKNLGIGLYPMEASAGQEPGHPRWKYALPSWQTPTIKMGVPHSRWVNDGDEETGYPIRDQRGNYVRRKTGGLEASMADIIQAVKNQDVTMIHVVDAIEITNISHAGPGGVPVPEGFVFASRDMVAVDACLAHHMFAMVPMADVATIRKEHNLTSDVIQKLPMPKLEGANIVSEEGYDSPFSRYGTLKYCENRKLGQQKFYVVGNDRWQGGSLASLERRLGRVTDGVFSELLPGTHYHTLFKVLWDFQASSLAYLEINDKLTGSDFKRTILEAYDENGDGVIDYMERGREFYPYWTAYELGLVTQDVDPLEVLKFRFFLSTAQLKMLRKEWNTDGHSFGQDAAIAAGIAKAFAMANSATEMPDPLFPGMTWGKGKWPSLQFAMHQQLMTRIYGQSFPDRYLMMSPYGYAFSYADARWNGAKYSQTPDEAKNADIIGNYHKAVAGGSGSLPFIFYVPRGLGTVGDTQIPNVEETDDPKLVFTVSFNGEEGWQNLRLSDFHFK